MADASARGWGKGWPNDRRRDMEKVTAGGVTLLVHKEIAPLIRVLLEETVAGGYQLVSGWCWGYANRAIAGTRRPSNHSWGLAVDLNAPKNPMTNRLVTDMPAWMPELWRRRGFRWGGDYTGKKDAMHYEFMGSLSDARRMVSELTAAPAPPPTPRSTNMANAPFVAILVHSSGGYLEIGEDGGVFANGPAPYYGSVPEVLKPGQTLNHPIVAAEWTPDEGGYYLIARDGGIFTFGNATYQGTTLWSG